MFSSGVFIARGRRARCFADTAERRPLKNSFCASKCVSHVPSLCIVCATSLGGSRSLDIPAKLPLTAGVDAHTWRLLQEVQPLADPRRLGVQDNAGRLLHTMQSSRNGLEQQQPLANQLKCPLEAPPAPRRRPRPPFAANPIFLGRAIAQKARRVYSFKHPAKSMAWSAAAF